MWDNVLIRADGHSKQVPLALFDMDVLFKLLHRQVWVAVSDAVFMELVALQQTDDMHLKSARRARQDGGQVRWR